MIITKSWGSRSILIVAVWINAKGNTLTICVSRHPTHGKCIMGITDIPYHMVFKWLFAKLIFCRFLYIILESIQILFGRTLLIFNWFCMITLGCTLKSKIISLFKLGCPYSNLLNHLSRKKSLQNRHIFYKSFLVTWHG